MGETCSVCGVAVAGADVMYAPDGRIVCTACFGNLAMPGASLASPWRKLAIAGGIAGAIPFAVHVSSSSSTTVNGQVTSFVYRDWIAVACGVVAIALGAITLGAARKEQLQRALAFAAGAGVLLLGGVQIARGFGVFADPGSNVTSSTSMSIDERPALDKSDPSRPELCSDPQACFDRGISLQRTDTVTATKAFEHACELGEVRGCYHAGINYLHRDTPEPGMAIPLLAKACDANAAAACTELGRAYATDGPTKDLTKAEPVLRKACDAGDANGCHYLGMFYDQGLGGKQDEKQARELFDTACTKGPVADACFFLGEMRRRAIGGNADTQGAMAAYTDGCKAGSQQACEAVKTMETAPTKSTTKKPTTKKK